MGVGKTPTAIAVAKQRKVKRTAHPLPVGRQADMGQGDETVVAGDAGDGCRQARQDPEMNDEGVFILSYSLLSMSKSGGFDYTAAVRECRARST